jgi:urease accessory protein
VPLAFVATMGLGFGLAVAGIELPFVEPAILASVIALGLLVAVAVQLPASACAAIVAIFALFHGHAHGSELGSAGALAFGIGFMIATSLLHVAGIGMGFAILRISPRLARLLGFVTAMLGLSLAFG